MKIGLIDEEGRQIIGVSLNERDDGTATAVFNPDDPAEIVANKLRMLALVIDEAAHG